MILLFLQLAAAASSPHQLDAIRFEMVITNQMVGVGAPEKPLVSRHTFVQSGDRVRMTVTGVADSLQGHPAFPSVNGFTIYRGKNLEMVTVDTVKREYYIVQLDSMAANSSPMLKMFKEANLTVSIDTAEATDLGPGPPMLGHPTRQWRLKEHVTMAAAMTGESVRITMGLDVALHYATDSALPANSMGSVAPGMASPFEAMLSKADKARLDGAIAKLPNAFVLRAVSRVRSGMGGTESGADSNMEVTRIEQIRVDSNHFDPPLGYKQVPSPFVALPGEM